MVRSSHGAAGPTDQEAVGQLGQRNPARRCQEVTGMQINRVLWGVWQVDRTGPVSRGADDGGGH